MLHAPRSSHPPTQPKATCLLTTSPICKVASNASSLTCEVTHKRSCPFANLSICKLVRTQICSQANLSMLDVARTQTCSYAGFIIRRLVHRRTFVSVLLGARASFSALSCPHAIPSTCVLAPIRIHSRTNSSTQKLSHTPTRPRTNSSTYESTDKRTRSHTNAFIHKLAPTQTPSHEFVHTQTQSLANLPP